MEKNGGTNPIDLVHLFTSETNQERLGWRFMMGKPVDKWVGFWTCGLKLEFC